MRNLPFLNKSEFTSTQRVICRLYRVYILSTVFRKGAVSIWRKLHGLECRISDWRLVFETVVGEDESDVLDAVEMLLKCVMERLILL